MKSKKSLPTKKPHPGNKWVECPTCNGAGEIIGRWNTILGGELTRCPRCFCLGWIEDRIDRPLKQGQGARKSNPDHKESLKGLGKPGTEDASDLARPKETIDWDEFERTLLEEEWRRASKERSKRILVFVLVAGLTVLVGAVVGVLLIFPILPDSVADPLVDLQQRVKEISGP